MVTIEQLGDLVFLEFLSISVERLGLLIEHRFDAVGQRIDCDHHPLKLEGIGFWRLDKTAFTQSVRLTNHGFKWLKNFSERVVG